MGESVVSTALMIFFIAIIYVGISTLRMILTVKGYKYGAAGIAVIEIMINITVLGMVLENVSNIVNLLSYVVGFGAGIVIGMMLENKLMLGYVSTNVVTKENTRFLAEELRKMGYGVTDWEANGREGERRTMQILTTKKSEKKLLETIKKMDPSAFIISQDTKTINGGFSFKQIITKK